MISTKIWETPLSWHAKFSLPVAVRVSKTRVLNLPNNNDHNQVFWARETKHPQQAIVFNENRWSATLVLVIAV